MKKRILLVSSFEETLYTGDLDRILENRVDEYKDNDFPGLSKAKLLAELSGSDPMSDRSASFVWNVITKHNSQIQTDSKGHSDINKKFSWNANRELNNVMVNILKDDGEVRILTTSRFPGAVFQLVARRIGLPKFPRLEIHIDTIPRDTEKQTAELKSEIIAESEDLAKEKYGKGATHTIFLDGNGSDISRFEIDRRRKKQSATGIQISEGMAGAISLLNKDIQEQMDNTNTNKIVKKFKQLKSFLNKKVPSKLDKLDKLEIPLTRNQLILHVDPINWMSNEVNEVHRNEPVYAMSSNQRQNVNRSNVGLQEKVQINSNNKNSGIYGIINDKGKIEVLNRNRGSLLPNQKHNVVKRSNTEIPEQEQKTYKVFKAYNTAESVLDDYKRSIAVFDAIAHNQKHNTVKKSDIKIPEQLQETYSDSIKLEYKTITRPNHLNESNKSTVSSDSAAQRKESREDNSETRKYDKMSEVKIERKNTSGIAKEKRHVTFSPEVEVNRDSVITKEPLDGKVKPLTPARR